MIYFFLELHVGQTVIYLRAEDATNIHSPYTVTLYYDDMTVYADISQILCTYWMWRHYKASCQTRSV